MTADLLLEASAINKSYGALKANTDVSLRIRNGGIHALIGENGAGKSTLVGVMCGAVQPDTGILRWRGKTVRIRNPAAARRLGIGVVFQHFSLVDQLTVRENVMLALGDGMSTADVIPQLRDTADKYGLTIDPNRRVGDLSGGEKQRVEILRCLLQQPRLLILDEPTSVLTPAEADNLFTLLRRFAGEGCGVLFISHKLDEVCALCDTATVLRHGRVTAADVDPVAAGREQLIELMLGDGGEHKDAVIQSNADAADADVILRVNHLRQPLAAPKPLVVDSLPLRAGVITGVAGIAGNGQDDLLDCLSGETTVAADMILMNDRPIGNWSSNRRRSAGILAIPTERNGRAAVGDLSLAENSLLGLSQNETLVRHGMIRPTAMRHFAAGVIDKFSVRADSPDSPAASLSGGNLQKFIVGRTLARKPRVLLVANPTWGVDVRAAAFIRHAIADLRHNGAAVLVLSEDLEELLALCDEITVINEGALSPPVARQQTSVAQIGELMARGRARA